MATPGAIIARTGGRASRVAELAAEARRAGLAASLPPIPADHVRLTHNTSSIEPFQHGAPFRWRGSAPIDSTTDAFSSNADVAEWASSGARSGFGPLTLLMDVPVDHHNKALHRYGWVGYQPLANESIVGHIDADGTFVPMQRHVPEEGPPTSRVLYEGDAMPYVQQPTRQALTPPKATGSHAAPQTPTLRDGPVEVF